MSIDTTFIMYSLLFIHRADTLRKVPTKIPTPAAEKTENTKQGGMQIWRPTPGTLSKCCEKTGGDVEEIAKSVYAKSAAANFTHTMCTIHSRISPSPRRDHGYSE